MVKAKQGLLIADYWLVLIMVDDVDWFQIYIRSTDKNRTIISAMSNILGMYGKNDGINIPGEDYPKDSEWPAGFVPVAIHSVEEHIDFVCAVFSSYRVVKSVGLPIPAFVKMQQIPEIAIQHKVAVWMRRKKLVCCMTTTALLVVDLTHLHGNVW